MKKLVQRHTLLCTSFLICQALLFRIKNHIGKEDFLVFQSSIVIVVIIVVVIVIIIVPVVIPVIISVRDYTDRIGDGLFCFSVITAYGSGSSSSCVQFHLIVSDIAVIKSYDISVFDAPF